MTSYSSNVSDSQWQIISKYLDIERNRKYELREIINAILYLVKTGCQWRMLPGDFPQWTIVYYYFSVWKQNGMLEEIHECLSLIHISEPTRQAEISYAVFCLKKKKK